MDLTDEIKSLIDKGESLVLCIIVDANGSAPRGVGAKMIVSSSGKTIGTVGGGAVELASIKEAKKLLETKKDLTKRFDLNPETSKMETKGMLCGGDVTIDFKYIDKVNVDDFDFDSIAEVKPRAIIFGAGHVSAAVTPVLNHIGFDVVVCDNRKDLISSNAFTVAKQTLNCKYKEGIDQLNINNEDYVLIMTPAHIADYEVLSMTLKFKPKYIGCLGSPKKTKTIKEKLVNEDGHDKSLVDIIHMPIGLKMNSHTPEEIAISIAGEMINVKNED